MNIITVTVNPALDLHISSPEFERGGYNNATVISRDSAGKGVNVSRALTENQTENLCYMILGREGYGEFIAPLEARGMKLVYTLTDGRVRENINIHHTGEETVIATRGPAVCAREVKDMEEKLLPLVSGDSIIVFSGSISDGSDKQAILSALYKFKSAGAALVIDSKSLDLEEIISLKPYLIKPNEREAEALTGLSITDLTSAAVAAAAMRDMGCENVLLTLGELGGVLASGEGIFAATVPNVKVMSTVGAGDSTIAGFLAAKMAREGSRDVLATALAYGTAACMEEGSLPPRRENIERLIPLVKIDHMRDM